MTAADKISILYIDDEKVNLLAFKANFRRDYKVFTASTSEEGKKLIEENDIKIVVADQRMPKMTGVEFFEWIREDHPDTIRVLLTGFSDITAVIDAINKGKVYSYVTKPWNEDELKRTFENACEEYERAAHYKSLEERYNHLLENALNPVLTMDMSGGITMANNAAVEMLQYSADEIQRMPIQEVVPSIESVENLMLEDGKLKGSLLDKFQTAIPCELSVKKINSDKPSNASIQLVLNKLNGE